MKSGGTKSVIIVEETPEYRALLKKILKSLDCYIVGESSGGDDAISLYERKKPDIVLLDILLPQKRGLDILKMIRKKVPTQVVIVLTAEADEDTVQSCIAAGALGYILKTDSANDIKDRIAKFIN